MKPMLNAVTSKLERMEKLSPGYIAALDVLLNCLLKEEKTAAAVRGRLLARLQAVHECRLSDEGAFDRGFEQIEPLGKRRQWKCISCGKIVTLERD